MEVLLRDPVKQIIQIIILGLNPFDDDPPFLFRYINDIFP